MGESKRKAAAEQRQDDLLNTIDEAKWHLAQSTQDGGQGSALIALHILANAPGQDAPLGAVVAYDDPTPAMRAAEAEDIAWFADHQDRYVRLRAALDDEVARVRRLCGKRTGVQVPLVAVLDGCGGKRMRVLFSCPAEKVEQTLAADERTGRWTALKLIDHAPGRARDFRWVEAELPRFRTWYEGVREFVRFDATSCAYASRPSMVFDTSGIGHLAIRAWREFMAHA